MTLDADATTEYSVERPLVADFSAPVSASSNVTERMVGCQGLFAGGVGHMADWVKLHTDLLDNPDLAEISPLDYQVFTFLIMLARREECSDGDLKGWTLKRLAYRFRMTTDALSECLTSLASVRWVQWRDDHVVITNYVSRQYDNPSDSPSATRERQRRRRDNCDLSRECHEPVTTCHEIEESRVEENRIEENRVDDTIAPSVQDDALPFSEPLEKATRKRKVTAGPAALYHWEKTNCRITDVQIAAINEAIHTPKDMELWRKVVDAWLLRGYSPKNIDGPLQWYRDGIPQFGSNGSAPQKKPASREPFYKEADLEAQRAKETADGWKLPEGLI